MIEIAIVTTAVTSRKSVRNPGYDFKDTEIRKGSIWVREENGDVSRACLECLTAGGVKLELEAFFERYRHKSISLQIIEPQGADKSISRAVLSLVDGVVSQAPHSYKKFSAKRKNRASSEWRFTPFDYGFASVVHENFEPTWYVEPEPMILLKSSAGDHYTYPSSDDDEEPTDVKNGRLGGLKKQANLVAKRKAALENG